MPDNRFAMSTRAFMEEEEFDDVNDVPLKLHSVMEFLDTALASFDGATEHTDNAHHNSVSSADSESEEDSRSAETPKSLRLTPFLSASAHPRQCYCLDKASCICKLFDLPPLLKRAMPHLVALPPAVERATPLSTSPAGDGAVPLAGATRVLPSLVDSVRFIPLRLTSVHLTKPAGAPVTAPVATAKCTSTHTTCCRC